MTAAPLTFRPKPPRGLIGVVHLAPMPGDPRYRTGGFEGVLKAAFEDAARLAEGGVDALILENFGSAPFERAAIPPHQVAALTLATSQCLSLGLPVGVNCLRNDVRSALGIAAATGASFVRVNVHVGSYVTDQGLIEGEAARTLRYRSEIGAQRVAILADVLVKHASPLAPVSARQATEDTLLRGLADGVIVTGTATGAPVSVELLREVREAAGEAAVYLGSGLSPERAEGRVGLTEGAIVGTWLKEGGQVRAPVEVARVRTMAQALKGRFRST